MYANDALDAELKRCGGARIQPRKVKVQMHKIAVCHECGFESDGDRNCEALARKHANETGHSPSLIVTYDIHPDD